MNIIKYFFSKSYRLNINEEYTKELCDKFLSEDRQLEEIYTQALSNIRATQKTSA